ncbi:ABC transporter permease [Patiriisocius sp. Uisw_017]|uniref:ABC transporter permease n=1 Tax=Patiriisocius sp. Uisw_017 TaxID=3230968 RepID=UPI0039ED694C
MLYFNKVFDALKFNDVIPATIKSFFFGFAIRLVGCHKVHHYSKRTVDVGRRIPRRGCIYLDITLCN